MEDKYHPTELHVLHDTIQRMAQVAEFHKPDIKLHLERIHGYCYVLSIGLGLSQEEAEQISYASMMHDVGMAGIPDTILTKKGELDHDEWELIKSHPLIGEEILEDSNSQVLQLGQSVARTHHERWDGSGYPAGLQGDEIPLIGRICGLADVFEAITTDRPYRDRVSIEDALVLIKESSGLFFDPKLVEVFVDNFEKIIEIRNSNL